MRQDVSKAIIRIQDEIKKEGKIFWYKLQFPFLKRIFFFGK